jgi:hypothetical protein
MNISVVDFVPFIFLEHQILFDLNLFVISNKIFKKFIENEIYDLDIFRIIF